MFSVVSSVVGQISDTVDHKQTETPDDPNLLFIPLVSPRSDAVNMAALNSQITVCFNQVVNKFP